MILGQDRLAYCAAFSNLGVGVSNISTGIPHLGDERLCYLKTSPTCRYARFASLAS